LTKWSIEGYGRRVGPAKRPCLPSALLERAKDGGIIVLLARYLFAGARNMAIDIREIELTDEQKRRIAELAEESGRPWREILDEELGVAASNRMKPYWNYEDRYIEDPEKWRSYFDEWLSRQTSHNPNFDDSRDSIYP
jgi:hypothetical protein